MWGAHPRSQCYLTMLHLTIPLMSSVMIAQLENGRISLSVLSMARV